MKVIELAKSVKTTVHTVRFYTKNGMLSPSKDLTNGYKQYSQKDLHRLTFILSARELGFSVKDIQNILRESDKGNSACPLVRRIIEERLIETEESFEKTLALRNKMKKAISKWKLEPNLEPTENMICNLIEDFIDFET
jgi:DNA-binding transcriptional MerR regulator